MPGPALAKSLAGWRARFRLNDQPAAMNGPRTAPHQTERELFLEVLERTTPGERAAFLDQACAHDPSLRAAVEALLRHHQADSFMDSPAITVASAPASTAERSGTAASEVVGEKPGDRVGSYRLLQQIGEGGVGVVFMAEQEAPVRRRVALKLLKPGMDTKTVVARFESERQALALMDHPNIAKVLDAGSTATGRPYFVMELVRGIRITEYCDQNRLPTRERLTLFRQWSFALDAGGTAQLRHLPSSKEARFAFNLRQVSGIAFSPDGRWLAAVSILGIGQLWDTATAGMSAPLQGFLQGTHSVAFSPDAQRLAIGSNGNEAVKLWDVQGGQELLTLPGQGSMFSTTAFSPDGSVLASSNSEGILHLWRAPSFEDIARWEAEGR